MAFEWRMLLLSRLLRSRKLHDIERFLRNKMLAEKLRNLYVPAVVAFGASEVGASPEVPNSLISKPVCKVKLA